jgi:serine/threonine protein phosphatase PrpC
VRIPQGERAIVTSGETTDVRVAAALATDVGLKRRLNEDNGVAEFPVFAVADGMGGHDSGEIASAIVVEELRTLVGPVPARADRVAAALDRAQRRVAELGAARPHGAGSTVSGVALVEADGAPHWLVFNVGDSRVYRSRGGALVQWTRDHSLLQQWLDQGAITPEQATVSRRGNEITRAVGSEDSAPDYFLAPVVNGERLLVCTDGLHGLVGPEALRASLVMGGTPHSTSAALVERALDAGGRDNVTVIVVDVVAGGAPSDPGDASWSLSSAAVGVEAESAPIAAPVAGAAGRPMAASGDAPDETAFVPLRRRRRVDDDTHVVQRASGEAEAGREETETTRADEATRLLHGRGGRGRHASPAGREPAVDVADEATRLVSRGRRRADQEPTEDTVPIAVVRGRTRER